MASFKVTQEHEELMKQWQEANDRISNPFHIQVEHFLKHKSVDGIRNSSTQGIYQNDRVLNANNQFLQLQMGYSPHQKRTFIISRTKTSRYDTASTDRDRQVRAEDLNTIMQRRQKRQEANGRKIAKSTVFLHNRENTIWKKERIQSFFPRSSQETLYKALPFFTRQQEMMRKKEVSQKQKELRDVISQNSREGKHEENPRCHYAIRTYLREENYLQMLIERKEASENFFYAKLIMPLIHKREKYLNIIGHKKNEKQKRNMMFQIRKRTKNRNT